MYENIELKGKLSSNYGKIEDILDKNRKCIISLPNEKVIVFNTSVKHTLSIVSASYHTVECMGNDYSYIRFTGYQASGKATHYICPRHYPGRNIIREKLDAFYSSEEVSHIHKTLQSQKCLSPTVTFEQYRKHYPLGLYTNQNPLEVSGIGFFAQKSETEVLNELISTTENSGILYLSDTLALYIKHKNKITKYICQDNPTAIFPTDLEGCKLNTNIFNMDFRISNESLSKLFNMIYSDPKDKVTVDSCGVCHYQCNNQKHLLLDIKRLLEDSSIKYIVVNEDTSKTSVFYKTSSAESDILCKMSFREVISIDKFTRYYYAIKSILNPTDSSFTITQNWECQDKLAMGILVAHTDKTILLSPIISETLKPPVVSLQNLMDAFDFTVYDNTLSFTKPKQLVRYFSNDNSATLCICAHTALPSIMIKADNNIIVYRIYKCNNIKSRNPSYTYQAILFNKAGVNIKKLSHTIFKLDFIIDLKTVLPYLREHGLLI